MKKIEAKTVWFIKVKLTKISYMGTFFNVWFIKNFVLFRAQFRQVLLYFVYTI